MQPPAAWGCAVAAPFGGMTPPPPSAAPSVVRGRREEVARGHAGGGDDRLEGAPGEALEQHLAIVADADRQASALVRVGRAPRPPARSVALDALEVAQEQLEVITMLISTTESQ